MKIKKQQQKTKKKKKKKTTTKNKTKTKTKKINNKQTNKKTTKQTTVIHYSVRTIKYALRAERVFFLICYFTIFLKIQNNNI